MARKSIDPRHRYIGDLNGFLVCISSDNTRCSINAIYVEVTENGFSMVSTNGRIMALKHYDKSNWELMRLSALAGFGVVMPMEPTQGALILGTSLRKAQCIPPFIPESESINYGQIFPYPKYKNAIPTEFENDRAKLPVFGFSNLAKAEKVFKYFGYRNELFYPTGWNSLVGAAVWKSDNFTLLLMPIRATEDALKQ